MLVPDDDLLDAKIPVLANPANPANSFQSGSGSGQIFAGSAGFLKIIQKFSKMLKM